MGLDSLWAKELDSLLAVGLVDGLVVELAVALVEELGVLNCAMNNRVLGYGQLIRQMG